MPVTTETAQAPVDHRKGPRRRGDALYRAIFQATLAELAEVGYTELTFERVAHRAGTGKASLYRRWPTRAELVAAAVRYLYPRNDTLPDTGDLREDMLSLLRGMADRIAGPAGDAARGLIAETFKDPELTRAARARFGGDHRKPMLKLLHRAAARGQVRPEAIAPHVADVGPALIQFHFLTDGVPIPEHVLTGIVDEVLLPLIRP